MNFTVFIPSKCSESNKAPVLFWLSGLTCTDENFITKAGAQRAAAHHGIILVCPDTSPRGVNIEGQSESWDFGLGAGFYVNATESKWSRHFNMYGYVTSELPKLIVAHFPATPDRHSISGHSMGGHGALICSLKNPGRYKSISAFAPICNPINCPWGQKAFTGYLGTNKDSWKAWDACELLKVYRGPPLNLLIDQGIDDKFYKEKQLQPEALRDACADAKQPVEIRMHPGYDHSYYFISTFIEDHISYHAKFLHS